MRAESSPADAFGRLGLFAGTGVIPLSRVTARRLYLPVPTPDTSAVVMAVSDRLVVCGRVTPLASRAPHGGHLP
ncbi:hypothetical protein ACIBAG_31295 [Streptomyces sp. NPDC051243]|uniref:hypothetical protein n=1 Tax=Streptomyces sp. NPDC051243 TaxID=3365646 RepID=UPI0037AD3CD7